MLKFRTKTVRYVEDARDLTRPEWTTLAMMAIYECFDKTTDEGVISTMLSIRDDIITDWSLRCDPELNGIIITTKRGIVGICPADDQNGIEVYFIEVIENTAVTIYSTTFSIEDLLENDIIGDF